MAHSSAFQLRWHSELAQAVWVLYLMHRHAFSFILKTASAIAAVISSQLLMQIRSWWTGWLSSCRSSAHTAASVTRSQLWFQIQWSPTEPPLENSNKSAWRHWEHGVSPWDHKPKPTPLSFLLFERMAIQKNFAFKVHNKYQGPLLFLLHNLLAAVTPKYRQEFKLWKTMYVNVVKHQ